jgi:CRP-like cAMP-binding protein
MEQYLKRESCQMLNSSRIAEQDNIRIDAVESLYDCKASPELVAAFEKRAIKVTCRENEVLFRDGEPGEAVYLILAGEIKLSLPITPRDGMCFRAQSGSFIGLPAAFSNEPYSMGAVARKDTEVAVMSRDKFCDLVAGDPVLALDVLRILAAETRAARITIAEGSIRRGSQNKTTGS